MKQRHLEDDMQKLEKQVETLQNQMVSLIKIFGLCGYEDGFIQDHDNYVGFVTQNYYRLNKDKLPVPHSKFNLLLKHLKLEIEPERMQTEKIVPAKIKKLKL